MTKIITLLFTVLMLAASSLSVFAEDEKTCFVCNGTGTQPCSYARCLKGEIPCPAPCLKLTEGRWEHMTVPGHPPTDLWRKFEYQENGQRASTSWNQGHVGELIVSKPGQKPFSSGRCPTCGGTTKVKCKKCNGTSLEPCRMCEGKKMVPALWTETDNPKVASDPGYIRLKDGRVIHGKIVMTLSDKIVIKPDQGKNIETTKDQVLPQVKVKK